MMVMSRFLAFSLCFAGLLAVTGGCGQPKNVVEGSVSLDDEPIKNGVIVFEPVDKELKEGRVAILDGKYSLPLKQGKYNVRITASKMMPLPASAKGTGSDTEAVREFVPEKYNTKTELVAEIKGSDKLDYKLKSK